MFSISNLRLISTKHKILQRLKHLASKHTRTFSFQVGDSAEICKTFSAADVRLFADLTGDHNPLHLDEDYARKTRFGKCIVHGVLTNGLISAVLATKLPGPGALFLSQDIEFPAPLYIDEAVTAQVEIASVDGHRVNCKTTCIAKDTQKVVMRGTVKLFMMKDPPGNT